MNYYYAVIMKLNEQHFSAEFPDFPESVTQGNTLLECYEMAENVLNICIEEYVRERREIPLPSSYEQIEVKVKEIISENKALLDLSFVPLIQVFKAPEVSMKPVKLTVSFPNYAIELIDLKAEKLGMTRSGFLVKAALAFNA